MTPTLNREILALQALTETSDLPNLLQAVVEAVQRWTGADRATLIRFDWEVREVTHFVRGGPGWAEIMASVGFDELEAGLSGWALRTGSVALSSKETPDPRESPEVQKRRIETHCGSIMVAPLGLEHRRLGTITVINNPEQPDFTVDDAAGLELFALFAASSIWLLESREATRLAQAEASTALRSKTNFLSNLSHELRTPLNGILGFSHLLEASNLDQEQRIMAQTILQSGQRLLGTIDNLLELAQFETGQFRLEPGPFSPKVVLDSVVKKHEAVAREKNLAWQVSTDPDLPIVLEGDAVRIGQAWNHVLANAVKFTQQGSISIHLQATRTHQGKTELILNVQDTGIGLSGEFSGKWFMPFHQEDGSLTRKFGGTGLGLALCDRIVRMMGGGLSLQGVAGTGTKVRVWVELGREPETGGRPHRWSILLQDSDPVGSLAMVRMLEKEGHRVDYVTTLEHAVQRLETVPYDAFILDAVNLGGENLRRLAPFGPPPGPALVGVFPFGQAPAQTDQVPWSAILTKPVTYLSLHAALRRCGFPEVR